MSGLGALGRLAWPTDPGAFRLWLALVVVFHHLTRIEVGKAPVLVFFALSGYWVHRVWRQQYALTRWPLLTFMVSRWWRIAPVLLLASAICVPLLWVNHDPDASLVATTPLRQLVSATAIFGYALLPTRPVGPAWSLDIEMQFYLIAPLLIAGVRRLAPGLVLALGFAVFVAAMAFGAGVTLPSFLPFFLIGMVAAEHNWRPDPRLAHGGLGLAVGLTGLAVAFPAGASLITEGGAHAAVFNLVLGMLAMPFALMTVVRRGDRTDAMFAYQSYLVYMLHWPAIALLRHSIWPAWLGVGGAALGLGAGVAVGCALVWRWLDQPLNQRRKQWVRKRMRKAKESGDSAKGGDTAALLA